MNKITDTSSFALLADEAVFDPIEERLRMNVRATIEAVFEEELASFLGRLRYGRGTGATKGYRHGHRERQLTGTFGTETVRVPRARIEEETGKMTEWRSKALPRYQRLTVAAIDRLVHHATILEMNVESPGDRRLRLQRGQDADLRSSTANNRCAVLGIFRLS